MKMLLALACTLAVTLSTFAADDEKKPSLGIGDAAPPVKPTKWLQGKEVGAFEKGHVYVVEFWTTWCGPCIVMMPHISELQDEFRDKGVTIIGFSAKDNNNGEEKVISFVEKRGKKLHYTLAFADNRETHDAYMKAAQRNGIPCCFVVDKESKIAFIGHPMLLDEVLPKVVAGTWKGKEDAEEVEKGPIEFREIAAMSAKDPEAALKAYEEFKAKHPKLANIVYYAPFKLSVLLKLEKFADAKAEAERLLADAKKNEDGGGYARVASLLTAPTAKTDKALKTLAVEAAETAVKLNGDKDIGSLLALADAYFATGDQARAKEIGAKAVEAAEPRLKPFIEKRIKKYDEDASEKKDS